MIRITSNAVPTSHIPNIKFVRSTDRRNSWNAREKTFLVGFGTGWALVAASLAIFDSRAIEFPTMKCSYASPSVFHDLLSLSPPPSPSIYSLIPRCYSHCWLSRWNNSPSPLSSQWFLRKRKWMSLVIIDEQCSVQQNYIGYMNYIFNIWAVGEKRGGKDVVCFVSSSGSEMIQISILVDWIHGNFLG